MAYIICQADQTLSLFYELCHESRHRYRSDFHSIQQIIGCLIISPAHRITIVVSLGIIIKRSSRISPPPESKRDHGNSSRTCFLVKHTITLNTRFASRTQTANHFLPHRRRWQLLQYGYNGKSVLHSPDVSRHRLPHIQIDGFCDVDRDNATAIRQTRTFQSCSVKVLLSVLRLLQGPK